MERTHVERRGAGQSRGDAPHFRGGPIDEVPHLLEQSYRLRYDVYCLERHFLPAGRYPTGSEVDEFDRHSLHVGAVDAAGGLVGTARAITVTEMGLPLFAHCTPFPHETAFNGANSAMVEVGRLVVDRRYRRRRGDVVGGAEDGSRSGTPTEYRGEERRRVGEDACLTTLKALYHETRRIAATHWLAAMEVQLQRQLVEQGFPFRAFGPESDYYGLVVPYQMALDEFAAVVQSGRFPRLEGFAAATVLLPGAESGARSIAEPERRLPRETGTPGDGT